MAMRLIIIDDEAILLNLYKFIFKTEVRNNEYQIETFVDGKDLVEYIESNPTDTLNDVIVIICDINMPVMDGYKVLSYIKSKFENVLVMISSAYNDEKTVEKIKELKADYFLPKPVDFNELKKTLGEIRLRVSGTQTDTPGA